MRKTIAILTAGSAIALATPAFAQDSGEATFTGPRVEAILGYDIMKAGSSIDDTLGDDNKSIDGLLYGAGIGYDMDLGGVVVGVEGEISDSTAKTKFANGDFSGFGYGNVKTNRDLYVGARVGAKVAPTTLLYVKGGYTNAKLDILSNDGTTDLKQDFDLDGWRVGAGVEQAWTRNMFTKLEYRYSNYQKAEVDFRGSIPDSSRFDVDTDRHQIVASVGVRF
jgi:outer membrane immunogenic protein